MESFLIAEKYVPSAELLIVAETVLKAQDIKEESWNGSTYAKTDAESAKEAVRVSGLPEIWIVIIHGWNVRLWNDVQAWAQEVIAA